MSDFLDEKVPPVRPLSTAAIEELGRCVLEQLDPDVLKKPQPLDVLRLVDDRLPKFGIHVSPASREELGDRAGATDPQGRHEIEILIGEEYWERLEEGGPPSYFAKTTVCHELGHGVLHVPVLRRRLLLTDCFARVERKAIKAYEDPEWQAWAFAGAILMPSVTLTMLKRRHNLLTAEVVAATYEVSTQMVNSHLKRLRWPLDRSTD